MRAIAALDWDGTVSRAEQSGLAPLLYVAVRGTGAPATVLARLRAAWLDSERRLVLARSQLREILGALGRATLPVIVLEGPALAVDYYADPALRPFACLRLLVHRADGGRAAAVLAQQGYEGDGRGGDEAPRFVAVREPSRLPVELVWACVPHPRGGRAAELAAEEIWSRAARAPAWGDTARALAPEDLLVCLAAALGLGHVPTDAVARLDLALLLRRHGAALDWDAVGARARRWRVAGATYFALRAVGDQLGVIAPTPLMHRLHPGELRVALMDRLQQAPVARSSRRAGLVGLVVLDRVSDVVLKLASRLMPRPEWLASGPTSLAVIAAAAKHLVAALARSLSLPSSRPRVGVR